MQLFPRKKKNHNSFSIEKNQWFKCDFLTTNPRVSLLVLSVWTNTSSMCCIVFGMHTKSTRINVMFTLFVSSCDVHRFVITIPMSLLVSNLFSFISICLPRFSFPFFSASPFYPSLGPPQYSPSSPVFIARSQSISSISVNCLGLWKFVFERTDIYILCKHNKM